MASITICDPDDEVMRHLRIRAAGNHRSMKKGSRIILRDAESGRLLVGPW